MTPAIYQIQVLEHVNGAFKKKLIKQLKIPKYIWDLKFQPNPFNINKDSAKYTSWY